MPGEVRLWKSLILPLYVVQLARRDTRTSAQDESRGVTLVIPWRFSSAYKLLLCREDRTRHTFLYRPPRPHLGHTRLPHYHPACGRPHTAWGWQREKAAGRGGRRRESDTGRRERTGVAGQGVKARGVGAWQEGDYMRQGPLRPLWVLAVGARSFGYFI
ncbi:hypothetical protein BKA56DRAFT_273481 [Ilyonectria sp. MPI-CAGE-AT-0026]|nr:hypothetical protein BKA56DRAFT_273481 [Ilyonectria sp. MPI-CAGE-AT-0026]